MEPLVPAVKAGGRPARHSRPEIVNANLYVVRGDNQWRAVPHDLLTWQSPYYYFWIWSSGALIYAGMGHLMLRTLASAVASTNPDG